MWCLLYCACLWVMGLGTVGVLLPPEEEESPALRLGMGACLGPGIGALGLIGFSMLGRVPSAGLVLCLTAPFAVLVYVFRSRFARRRRISTAWIREPRGWFDAICLAAMAYGVCIAIYDAASAPVIVGDAFSIWLLKAKALATHALFPRPDYFFDVSLSYSHLRYPILVPMISAGVFGMSGNLQDGGARIPFLLSYLGLGAAVYGAVRSMGTRRGGLAAAAILMTAPMALAQAVNGTADMALAAFWGCSIIAILRWRRTHRTGDMALALLFTVCMAWSKNEGLPLAVLNAAAVLLFVSTPSRLRSLAFALGVGVLYLPWFLYSRDFPRTDEDYGSRLGIAAMGGNLHRLPFIFGRIGEELVDVRRWGIFWFLPAAAAVLKPMRSAPVLILWFLLIGHLLIYIPPYLVAPGDLGHLMEYSLSRVLLHVAPAGALIVGLQFFGMREREIHLA